MPGVARCVRAGVEADYFRFILYDPHHFNSRCNHAWCVLRATSQHKAFVFVKTSACGVGFMSYELRACRSTAESMPRFSRPILSPYTSLATAGFAPFVSRHWPVSAPFPVARGTLNLDSSQEGTAWTAKKLRAGQSNETCAMPRLLK